MGLCRGNRGTLTPLTEDLATPASSTSSLGHLASVGGAGGMSKGGDWATHPHHSGPPATNPTGSPQAHSLAGAGDMGSGPGGTGPAPGGEDNLTPAQELQPGHQEHSGVRQ